MKFNPLFYLVTATSSLCLAIGGELDSRAPANFRLQVKTGVFKDYFVQLNSEGSTTGQYASLVKVESKQASVFQLSGVMLLSGLLEGNQIVGQDGGPVFFIREARGRAVIECRADRGLLTCKSDGDNTQFYGCQGRAGSNAPQANVSYLRLGPPGKAPKGCAEQSVKIVSA